MAHTITGLLLDTDGNLDRVEVANSNGSHLASMYAHIGCRTVDLVTVPTPYGHIDAWVDDEGAYTSNCNYLASLLLGTFAKMPGARIYGTVLLLASDEEDTVGLSAEQVKHIVAYHRVALTIPDVVVDLALARNGLD